VSGDWRDRAACRRRGVPLGAFFPGRGGWSRPAKELCAGCPVRSECLAFAIDNDIRYGIWGGLSITERRRLVRQRTG
jgi:WhiB family transcriptional regulator, redox-sensing transcriptional regulator